MRRATSGASIGPLSKQLTPILSVAAHEGPYAFKFKGLTLWLAKTPRLKLLGAFRRTDTGASPALSSRTPPPRHRRPKPRETRGTARRFRRDAAEIRPADVTAAKLPAQTARNAYWCARAAARGTATHTEQPQKTRGAR